MAQLKSPNITLTDQDDTATQGFEKAGQSAIPIEPWQCPHCLKRFGESGRNSGQVNVITAKGPDKWCMECYNKGVEEGICYKEKKLSKKEKKRLKKLGKK